mgnify:CR=1 FL=1
MSANAAAKKQKPLKATARQFRAGDRRDLRHGVGLVLHCPANMHVRERRRRAENHIFHGSPIPHGIAGAAITERDISASIVGRAHTGRLRRELCLPVELRGKFRRRLHLDLQNFRLGAAPVERWEGVFDSLPQLRQDVDVGRVCGRRHKGKFAVYRTAHIQYLIPAPTCGAFLRALRARSFSR